MLNLISTRERVEREKGVVSEEAMQKKDADLQVQELEKEMVEGKLDQETKTNLFGAVAEEDLTSETDNKNVSKLARESLGKVRVIETNFKLD